jgi:uncharacterized protein YjiS (DUF1127 family)
MTTITYHRTHSPSFGLPSLPQFLTRLLRTISLRLQTRRTERMLESMPMELRKDIGWPTTDIADATAAKP